MARNTIHTLVGVCSLLWLGSAAQATQRLVPSQYATIQAGIDAAAPGDTVLIINGTYAGPGNQDLDFGGKAIAVRSAGGDPSLCLIDCQRAGRGFTFHSGETSAAAVSGITIRNGVAGNGGAISCTDNSAPTITRCILSANKSTLRGGALYCNNSSPTLSKCDFTGNESENPGGGIYNVANSNPSISDCSFVNNKAFFEGGGVSNSSSSPTIARCLFSGNVSTSSFEGGGAIYNQFTRFVTVSDCTFTENRSKRGGGISTTSGNCVVTRCTFLRNFSNGNGGGLSNYGSGTSTVANCVFVGNQASFGGGLNVTSGTATLTNCLFTGNQAENDGGAIYATGSGSTLTNCTLTANSALRDAGGILNASSGLTVTNCILWADTNAETKDYTGSLVITNSDVQGGFSGTGNLNADPLFTDPANGDFHLQAASSGIDMGSDAVVTAPPFLTNGSGAPLDLDGNLRIAGSAVDMGAYEKIRFSWSGVLQPLNADGSSVCKAGSTVPVKFVLTGPSAGIADLKATLSYAVVVNGIPGPVISAKSTSAATSGNLFRPDGADGRYLFNWSTKGLASGSYRLYIDLGDGFARTIDLKLK